MAQSDMNEPEDSESTDEEMGGSDAGGTGVPWNLPTEDGSDLAESDNAASAESTAPDAGILRVWCPGCEGEVNISREYLGIQGICPNCELPIVASMRPDDSGGMRVVASEVLISANPETVALEETEESVALEETEETVALEETEGLKDLDLLSEDIEEKLDLVKKSDDSASPSWAEGGNPWDALGLNERKADEASNESEIDLKSDEAPEGKEEALKDLDFLDDVELEDVDEEREDEVVLQEQKESRSGLIIAVVIILVVGGVGLTIFLKPDLIRGSSVAKENITTGEVVNASNSKSTGSGAKVAKASNDGSDPSAQDGGNNTNVSSAEPRAVKRPDEDPKTDHSSVGRKLPLNTGPKPKMATARVDVDDEVALRLHQEGEGVIRRFYRARSVEERSAFVVNPKQAVKSMRKFYGNLSQLPTIRYLEFKGKLQDPASGLRFGVFDVHEKENEESHRWCVVEIEPSEYALDWGFYEQLENSTLISYLSEVQSEPKKFRFLMKLGDSVSAVDSPWDEVAVKVHLQLPLAGGGGGETLLLKKSEAEKFGILEELAEGKMKIGRVELNWVSSDKDKGSKVPTISRFYGWGAWAKNKMRGLN